MWIKNFIKPNPEASRSRKKLLRSYVVQIDARIKYDLLKDTLVFLLYRYVNEMGVLKKTFKER